MDPQLGNASFEDFEDVAGKDQRDTEESIRLHAPILAEPLVNHRRLGATAAISARLEGGYVDVIDNVVGPPYISAWS